jgi:lipoyl(octanoyl) transferase
MHGFSINVAPDLSHFGGIVPCGIADYGVTSLAALGLDPSMEGLDKAIEHSFPMFLNNLSNISQAA